MFGKSKEDLLAELLEGASSAKGRVPESSLKALRGSISQLQLAAKSGVPQAYLSQLEAGKRDLTPEMAMRLAPHLGVSATELWLSDKVSRLHQASTKGQLEPHAVLETVLELAKATPDSEIGDELMEALLSVLKDALDKVDMADVQTRGTTGPEAVLYSAKSRQPRPDRDHLGRRINKPNAPGR